MTLTIIIPTIVERRQLLSRCLFYMDHQTDQEFQVIVVESGQGVGDKINWAFEHVETSHLMMCSDDDWVSERLVEMVKPFDEDFVGFDIMGLVGGRFYDVLPQALASHICPIQTDLARAVPFPNDYGTDGPWRDAVAETIQSSAYVHEPLYFYDKWNAPEGGYSPPRDVGFWPYDESRWLWI